MLATFAEFERASIRKRTQAGLHRALRNGKYSGRIPYGYRLTPDESGLEVVEDEAAVVRGIIANVADGATLYGESKRLNDEVVPSPGWRFKNGGRKHGIVWSGHLRPSQPSSIRAPTPVFTGSRRTRVT